MRSKAVPAVAAAIIMLAAALPPAPAEAGTIHHDLKVRIFPDRHAIEATDNVTLPDGFARGADGTIRFTLHQGLTPRSATGGVRIETAEARGGDPPLATYRLTVPPGVKVVTIEYSGTIHQPLQAVGEEYARGQKDTSGSIGPEGIYLVGRSGWHPRFEGERLLAFRLTVDLPAGWDVVSQGERKAAPGGGEGIRRVAWTSRVPQDEIYIVGGRFTEYVRDKDKARAMVFLRAPDDALAQRYLDATARYLALYEGLIGPYPFPKFALVENFWETGYGLPEATLLGPTVLRLPFIVNTSYPHEILHGWWGNGVYIDYDRGNWGEGLTAYLADHLLKEQQGTGAEYRKETLQKYADYVIAGRDLPLTEFRSRHGSVTEAVGYGKALMLFHMLRLSLGDEVFVSCLKTLYRDRLFKTADFGDVRKSFEKAAGRPLSDAFDPWVTRTGAPVLRIRSAEAVREAGGYRLRAILEQAQSEEPYPIRVPLAVTIDGWKTAHQSTVTMRGREARVDILLPGRPLRLDVDPEFDVFRRLDRDETPPALTQAFGAERVLILLPSGATQPHRDAWRELAGTLSRTGPGTVEIAWDADVPAPPDDRSVWLFGWENRFLDRVRAGLAPYGAAAGPETVSLEGTEIARDGHAFALAVRRPGKAAAALLWIAADDPDALPGLGRKLPHYHKYSYLAFEGKEPVNVSKGRWPVAGSPMTVTLQGKGGGASRVGMGRLAPRKALADLPPPFSKERMMETVRFLADPVLEGRGFGTPGLDRAAGRIARGFADAGLVPGGDPEDGWFQSFTERGGDPEREAVLKNVVGFIPGTVKERAGESVVVAAHYDHIGTGWPPGLASNRGKVHPGADDNGSGVAVLLELARVLGKNLSPERPVVFVAFSAEEAGQRGSKHYVAREKRHPASSAIGMINIDTVGRFGNKLLVLSAGSAREWPHIFRGAGQVAGVETEIVAKELEANDHDSFLRAGVPAVQLFTGAHPDYHRPTDTSDKVNGDGLVKVASVAREAVEYLASRKEPLTSSLPPPGGGTGGQERKSAPERKAGLGVIPDFAYEGEGVRLSGVIEGSPASKAGLREGDIVVRIDDSAVGSLKDLSRILSSYGAGGRATVTFLRGGASRTAEAVLEKR